MAHPLYANIGNNPNINLDPPPPPIGVGDPQPIHIIGVAADPAAPPTASAPALGILVNGAVAGAAPPPAGTAASTVLTPPPAYPGLPFSPLGFGMGPMGMGMGMGMPMGMPFGMGMGLGMTPQGFPPAPNPGSGVSPLPSYGYAGGMIPPPFATGGMPWAAAGAATPFMGPGMGMGFAGGFFPGGRPPLPFIDGEGGGVGPDPGAQSDPTVRPGGDLPGHTVVQPQETCSIFRILTNCLPWEHAGMQLQIEPMQFDAGWTVNRVIKAMRKPHDDCQGWGLTQCIELGGGRWAKGMTYVFGSQMATECSLGMVGMGSGSNRDGTREKVYVVLHRV